MLTWPKPHPLISGLTISTTPGEEYPVFLSPLSLALLIGVQNLHQLQGDKQKVELLLSQLEQNIQIRQIEHTYSITRKGGATVLKLEQKRKKSWKNNSYAAGIAGCASSDPRSILKVQEVYWQKSESYCKHLYKVGASTFNTPQFSVLPVYSSI